MSDNKGNLWGRDEIEQLKQEINQGDSLEQMCAAHGRTPYAIIGRLQQMNILVLIGRNYHRVDPDPWELGANVRDLQHRGKE